MQNGLDIVRSLEAGTRVAPSPEIDFIDTVKASLAYKYNPVLNYFEEQSRFPNIPEDGYSAIDNIPENLKPFGSYLLRATNQEHMDYLIGNLESGFKTRETLAQSGFFAQFAAEVFDPINYVAIPFAPAATFAKTAARGALATGAVVTAQEAVRYPLDPLATPEEAAINIGSAALIGGALSGLVTIPMQRRLAAQQDAQVEIDNLRTAISPEGEEPEGKIAPSLFTDSWLYKAVTTPVKRILTNDNIPNSVKLTTLKIANDSGILLAANKQGQKIGNSVYQNAKLLEGEWVKVYDETMNIWGESTGKGVVNPLDYTFQRKDFETWLEGVDSKAMRGIEPADDFEARAMASINKFYENWEQRLNEQGLIGSAPYYEKFILGRERRIEDAQKRLETARAPDYIARLEAQVRRYSDEITEARAILDDIKEAGPVLPPNEKLFRPRYWDQDAIRANLEDFKRILTEWYTKNPSIIVRGKDGKSSRVMLDTSEQAIRGRVDETVDTILGIKDILDPEIGYYGAGKSKHFKHRLVDIPNELVLDYIQTNPVAVMKAYTQRTGARYEFARMFGGDTIDDVLDDVFNQMMDAGKTQAQAHAAMKDMRHLYKRVVGGLQRDPDSWGQSTARVLRNLAQLNYLGSAGVSTMTEPAKIMMEHGLGRTFRGLFSIMKNNQLKMGAKEGRLAAEGIDNLMNSAHLRLIDDVNNNPFRSDILDRAKSPFYLLNGLGPITKIFKDFDAMMRSHTLIDYSVRWTQGKATKQEQEYLLRYNINLEDAKKIANAPWQKSEAGFYMANTEAWTNTIEFPATKAEVISGPTNTFDGDRYKPAFYRESENKIYIDEEHIIEEMWPERGWENPRTEGVRPIKKGIINSPEDYVTFVKMHEIMHSIYRPEDLGIFGEKIVQKDFSVSVERAGFKFSRTYKSAKQIDKEINLLDLEMDRQQELISAFRDAGADPRNIDDLISSFEHNSAIRNELDRIQKTKEYADQLKVEKNGKPITKLNNEQKAAYENAINDLAIAEIEKQARVDPETVRTFRNALSSGIMNTILMGTPADKPIITDGIVYIPMRVARQFGMKEDKEFKGYARIENALLGLPFQFYSYSFAALNKITAAYGHGQLKNQWIGTAMSMGLGYMVLQYKTPDFVEMDFEDQFARSFDYSGVAALYSDIFYTAMSTSLALGGPNITGGVLQPRFPQKPDALDAATGVLGAGPSIAADLGRGVYDLTTGNIGEGTKEIIRNLPFMRMWFWKGKMNELTNMIEGELDDGIGFGRY